MYNEYAYLTRLGIELDSPMIAHAKQQDDLKAGEKAAAKKSSVVAEITTDLEPKDESRKETVESLPTAKTGKKKPTTPEEESSY